MGHRKQELRKYEVRKAQKKAQKVAKRLRTSNVAGYSNDSNRFGDPSLNEGFTWLKKIERDLTTQELTPSEMSLKAEKKRQRDRMAEIQKVKKRREERETEKAHHEEDMALLARERGRASEYQDLEEEEVFHFEQSKLRSQRRLQEGRAKPIDELFKYSSALSGDYHDLDLTEPHKVYKGNLTMEEMEELRRHTRMYLRFDNATQTHIEFWESMMVVCDWEIEQTQKRDMLDKARLHGEERPHDEQGLHGVHGDVDHILQALSVAELDLYQEQTEAMMRTGTAHVVEFWEAVLKRLPVSKAMAQLRKLHIHLLQNHSKHTEYLDEFQKQLLSTEVRTQPTSDWEEVLASPEPAHASHAGNYSPEPTQEVDCSDIQVLDPAVDKVDLESKRAQVLAASKDPREHAAVINSMGGLEDGDALLGAGSEVNLIDQVYWWHDKYRPRKPKYFNRVHTGYEWNKYNQTHYDHDNPPPKFVQGYKFNIFYPNLVDKTKAPQCCFMADGNDDEETCVVRFHAGPPYEDIAFRIVKKDWEFSPSKGFKCTFVRGVLQLHFNFKRFRYRR